MTTTYQRFLYTYPPRAVEMPLWWGFTWWLSEALS